MNYAWANPSTGIREQAATEAEARLQAWEALQRFVTEHAAELPAPEPLPVTVFEQESVGWASQTSWDCIEYDPWPDESYAWADPSTGKRRCNSYIEVAKETIQFEWPKHAPVDQVAIYRQRHAFSVHSGDPKPPVPPPIVIPPDTPSSLLAEVMEGTCAELGRAQLLAVLWIAEALQKAVNPPAAGTRSPGVFARIAARWRGVSARIAACFRRPEVPK